MKFKFKVIQKEEGTDYPKETFCKGIQKLTELVKIMYHKKI